MKIEQRALAAAPELRTSDDGGKIAAGYAALFNVESQIGDWFIERLAPGAFAETLKSADVRALVNHDSGRVIGRSSAGTLRLAEDDKGLAVEIDLPDTSDGRDLAVQLERRDISGMSFGFRAKREEWDETGELPVRTILEAELVEVSAVAFPQYGETEIALRSLERARGARNAAGAMRRLQRKAALDLRARRISTGR